MTRQLTATEASLKALEQDEADAREQLKKAQADKKVAEAAKLDAEAAVKLAEGELELLAQAESNRQKALDQAVDACREAKSSCEHFAVHT